MLRIGRSGNRHAQRTAISEARARNGICRHDGMVWGFLHRCRWPLLVKPTIDRPSRRWAEYQLALLASAGSRRMAALGHVASFPCAAEFGRYRSKADSGQPNDPVDLWVHGLGVGCKRQLKFTFLRGLRNRTSGACPTPCGCFVNPSGARWASGGHRAATGRGHRWLQSV
jgi:hypothetical protein